MIKVMPNKMGVLKETRLIIRSDGTEGEIKRANRWLVIFEYGKIKVVDLWKKHRVSLLRKYIRNINGIVVRDGYRVHLRD